LSFTPVIGLYTVVDAVGRRQEHCSYQCYADGRRWGGFPTGASNGDRGNHV